MKMKYRYVSLVLFLASASLTFVVNAKSSIQGLGIGEEWLTDTVIVEDLKTGEKRKVRIITPGKDEDPNKVSKEESKLEMAERWADKVGVKSRRTSRPILGITFSRVDLGFNRILDNGSFSLSEQHSDLEYRPGKTANFGFDVLQAGYRFNDHFRIFLSGGFDWTYYRLQRNIDFAENTTPLTWTTAATNYSKNRLTATYLRLPLTFEFRSAHNSALGRTRFAFGPEVGFLLKGTQRFKSDEFGKQKFRDDYNLSQFRYGATARFGVGPWGIYGKYYFNDIFENSPAQAGLQNFAFGLMFGF